jgi:crotonobetainyl-CoA:carnitine CoA-transferase CaiB-like acyl-CoA transferase
LAGLPCNRAFDAVAGAALTAAAACRLIAKTGHDGRVLPMTPHDILAEIWALAGLPPEPLGQVRLSGAEPALASSFRVGAVAQASIAAAGLAAAELWRRRGGEAQEVAVEMRHAAMEFLSEHLFTVDGGPPPGIFDKIWGLYPCGDGRWVRLHTNFPHHREGVLGLLKCEHSREAVAEALKGWKAAEFEAAAAEVGAVVSMMRSPEEWQAHPHCQALDKLPLLSFEKLGEAPPRPLPAADRPLAGVRVLDLTRIIAGPVAGRTLAAHGADVLRVTGPHLPFNPALIIDAGRGKLSAHIDLRQESGRETLRRLLENADVFTQGYRPGAVAQWGFAPEQAAELRPGIVYVSLSAWGHVGPWAGKRGFDSIVQTASGINFAEGRAAGVEGPKPLPCQALDHGSGYLMAFGAMAGLLRRAEEGGSWHVRVALARTGRWLQGLGRLENGFDAEPASREAIADYLEEADSGFGRLSVIRHAAQLSKTPARWARPAMPLGSHPPEWPN